MVWIMLATLVVVFVVGFRILTSDSRRAIKRLSERLGITLVPVESMIDQFGKTPGNEFIRYLERPDEAHLQNAQVLLIWQVCIVNGSEEHTWHRLLRKAPGAYRCASASRSALCARWSQIRRNLTLSSCATTSFSCRRGRVLPALISRIVMKSIKYHH
jgi:hypothetical protein